MNQMPKILKHKGILTNWRGYPPGSLERAKALGIDVWATFKNVDATLSLWESKKRVVAEHKPWEMLGLSSLDEFIEAVTGVSTREVEDRISKTDAIRQRRKQFPKETQQQTADAVGCRQSLVNKVITKKFETNEKVIIPSWIKGKADQATFRKLSPGDQEEVRQRGKGSLRGIAIRAGLVKVPSLVEQAEKLWKKMTAEEKAIFLTRITP